MNKKHISLYKKLIFLIFSVMSITSLFLLVLVYSVYHLQLKNERSQASQEVNQLLQAALENSMLKRDLPGLQNIINRLATQDAIQSVIILNPKGEVRFSSEPGLVGKPFDHKLVDLCPGCEGTFRNASTATHMVDDLAGNKYFVR